MIEFTAGNILEAKTDALVNTVNLDGYMGKGIAYQFKKTFPENDKAYVNACKTSEIDIGQVFVTCESGQYIINFPTKAHWREKARYDYIERGMKSLLDFLKGRKIASVAIPPLGCGNGGLEWGRVRDILVHSIESETELNGRLTFVIYEPSKSYKSRAAKSPKLNASHLVLMETKQRLRRFNKLRLQKTAYFVNLYAKTDYFRFQKHKYGPYSHAVDVLSRQISEFQEYNNVGTAEGITLLRNQIVSDSVERKLELYLPAVELATELVNQFDSDVELEAASTVIDIVKVRPDLSEDDVVNEFREWPKESQHRFPENQIRRVTADLLEKGVLRRSLVGVEVNSEFFETTSA